jgi:hypothetical protein
MTETNRIEYKLELTKELDLEKEVIAFLNYHEGGIIYVGIDKNGGVVGLVDLDGDMLKIKDRLKTNISPSCMGLFDVSADEKEALYINVDKLIKDRDQKLEEVLKQILPEAFAVVKETSKRFLREVEKQKKCSKSKKNKAGN